MPLVRIDTLEGRSAAELRCLLDEVHAAVVEAFEVPASDRYQIVTEHPPGRLVLLDTGLGFERTDRAVVVSVTSRRRSSVMKESFYAGLVDRLAQNCGVVPSDVVVTMVENGDEDWSFGAGRAQFLTGELS